MKRHAPGREVDGKAVYTALMDSCPDCQHSLNIYQVISRPVQGLDSALLLVRRDKRCCQPSCPGEHPIFYAPRDLRVVLPNRIYGLDVTLYVGEQHLGAGVSQGAITRALNARGVPLDQRHTGRVLRDFLALASLARGDDAALQARLRAQGGMVLMCDGVQFDERSPVLYLVWDAISGTPLFGERKLYRGEEDLVPLLERARAMDVPVIGIVTDKEKGLVPAVERVFHGVPYQFCQTHFLKNCAKPLQPDLTALQASVRQRADAVRKLGKRLSSPTPTPAPKRRAVAHLQDAPAPQTTTAKLLEPPDAPGDPGASPPPAGATLPGDDLQDVPAAQTSTAKPSELADAPCAPGASPPPAGATPLSEEALVREVCELVRVNSRVSGKAPLDPPELKRHERLEDIRALVNDARKKKPGRRQTRAPARSSTS